MRVNLMLFIPARAWVSVESFAQATRGAAFRGAPQKKYQIHLGGCDRKISDDLDTPAEVTGVRNG